MSDSTTYYDVLLIDDDLATIKLLTSYFNAKSFTCKGVLSGSEGLDELKKSLPKLILLEIILPDLNGYDICKTIKSDHKNLPVYFFTAISGSEVEKIMDETGADGFILKPLKFSDLEVLIKHLKTRSEKK